MKVLWPVALLMVCGFSSSNTANQNPPESDQLYYAFKKGEYLGYNIHYGFIDAGMASFEVADTMTNVAGRPHFVCKVIGRSYGWWDNFYKVRDYYYSYVDSVTLMPTVYSRNVSEGDYRNQESYWFNRDDKVAKGKYNGENAEVAIPEDVHDLVSMIYFMRGIDFTSKPQDAYQPLNVFFENEWHASGMKLAGKEVVETTLGKFRCLKIVPQLVEGRVFKGQDDMVVYVSDDANQIPIRIESAIFVGSIKVDLIEYRNLKYPLTCKLP